MDFVSKSKNRGTFGKNLKKTGNLENRKIGKRTDSSSGNFYGFLSMNLGHKHERFK